MVCPMDGTKTLKLRLKDKHAKVLRQMAREQSKFIQILAGMDCVQGRTRQIQSGANPICWA